MTWQQRLWRHGQNIWYASKPLLFYAMLPPLLTRFGQLFRVGKDADLEEFLRVSKNFYLFAAHLLVWWCFVKHSRKRGTTLCAETGLYWRRGEANYTLAAYCFLFGMAAALFFSALITLLPMPVWLREAYQKNNAPMYGQADVLLLVPLSAVLAPFLEEIVLRGYMLSRLSERYNVKTALWGTALVFAICHGSPVSFVYALFMGLAFALIEIRMDNLLYPICMHSGFNALAWINTVILLCGVKTDFFGSWYLVLLYGLAGALGAYLIGQKIKDEEKRKI